jgi:phosphoglycerate dehydrogenase-like enzyme
MPRILATPHTAGSSQQSHRRIWSQIVDNLDRLAEGRPLRNVVNRESL